MLRSYWRLISGTIWQTKSISRSEGPRAEMTMQNVFDCRSAASFAASRSFGAESRL
jgi:hypothetical protein